MLKNFLVLSAFVLVSISSGIAQEGAGSQVRSLKLSDEKCKRQCTKENCKKMGFYATCKKECGLKACENVTPKVTSKSDANEQGNYNAFLMMNEIYSTYPQVRYFFDRQFNKFDEPTRKPTSIEVKSIKTAIKTMRSGCQSVINKIEGFNDEKSVTATVSVGGGVAVKAKNPLFSGVINELKALLNQFDALTKKVNYSKSAIDLKHKDLDALNLPIKNCFAQGQVALYKLETEDQANIASQFDRNTAELK